MNTVELYNFYHEITEITETVMSPPRCHDKRWTPRRVDIVRLLAAGGGTNNAIGRELGISPSSVKTHLQIMFSLFKVHSREELVLIALRQGVID